MAIKDLDAAAAIDARNPVVFRARGAIAQQRNLPREAITAYTTALDIDPASDFALGHRAEAYRAVGDDDNALRDAAAALKQNPRRTDMYLMRANILRTQGKVDAAATEAAAIATAKPADAYAQVAAGNVYGAIHRYDDAMRAYDRALAIKPEAYIYLNRSQYRPKTDLANRRGDVEAALKLDPTFEEALAAKADLQADAGDFLGAAATFTAAIAKSPDAPGLLLGRGIAFARAGDATRADKDFAAARAKTSSAAGLNNSCWAKATHNVALASALSDCDAAIAKRPDYSPALDSRAFTLLRLNRLDEALATYDSSLADTPTQAASLYGRAIAWARKGNKAKSDADAASALRLNPEIRTEFDRYGIKL